MFHFFSEIKKELHLPDIDGEYNIVNINGGAVYVEGQKGLVSLSDDQIVFRVKGKIVGVFGKDLKLKEMSSATLSISGEIDRIEVN